MKMKTRTGTVAGFLLSVALGALAATAGIAAEPASPQLITVEHFQGKTEIAPNPARVFVYDLGILDMLDALGIPVAGVPGTNVPPSLARYKEPSYVKIGSLFDPDYETVHAEKPDVILIGPRTSAKYAELSALAPTIDLTVDAEPFLTNVKARARTIGEIFGKQEDVEARIARLDNSVAELRKQTAGIGKGLIVLITGGKISAYGPKSRFGELHEEFGIAHADPNLAVAVHGQAISSEYILELDPDWLFVVDRDAAVKGTAQTAQQLLDNELVRRTKAWQKGRVVYLDPVKVYLTSSSLRAQQELVDELSAEIKEKSGH